MYQALYRKWRPQTFADVLSQPQVTTTLQNQLKNKTTAHAYLFTGSRGTGKTTCARILAKAVNCLHPRPDGNPCLECEICKEAEQGILSDFVEIDAASNNSVEDIRDLRDATVYTPEKCTYKVYIIDEVHMLSTSAFNALLKILEEPPAYVKFILATTEIHKVPATIISRCQRYDFRRIQQKDLVERLQYIAGEEQIPLESSAAELIARLSDGGMRDAISLLDRCSAYGETITEQIAAEAAGTAGRDYLIKMTKQIFEKDISGVLQSVSEMYETSKDLQKLCEELILMQRDFMLLKATGDVSLLHCMKDEIPVLQDMAANQNMNTILQNISLLQNCRERMNRSVNKRVELEMTLISICTDISAQSAGTAVNSEELQQLMQRLSRLEQPQKADPRTKPQPAPVPNVQPEVPLSTVKNSDWKPLAQWAEVLEECRIKHPDIWGTLDGSKAVSFKNLLVITTDNELFMEIFKIPKNKQFLMEVLFKFTHQQFSPFVKCSRKAIERRPVEDMLQQAKNSGISTTAVQHK